MNRHFIHIITVMATIIGIAGCKPGVPKEVIQPDDMEEILYDYFVSQGMASIPSAQAKQSEDYTRDLYFNSVLLKHGITRAEFDSSLVYYYTRADRFVGIYRNVQERLSEEALNLGASEGEVERFTTQSLSGDTANVWEGVRYAIMIPQAPYNRLQFVQEADTSYRKDDNFMLVFNSDFVYQGGSKDALVYFAVKCDNDSVVSQVSHFSVSGTNQVRINCPDMKAKEILGYFYLGQGYERSSELKLLSLSNIQLIRFHRKKKKEEEAEKVPEVPVMSDSARHATDSIRRARQHKFGVKPQD